MRAPHQGNCSQAVILALLNQRHDCLMRSATMAQTIATTTAAAPVPAAQLRLVAPMGPLSQCGFGERSHR